MSDHVIREGDIVRLKSGSPDMTVEKIGMGLLISQQLVFVAWYEDGRLRKDSFQRDALEKVDASSRRRTWRNVIDLVNSDDMDNPTRNTHSGNYRIKINDFGPIAHADIDLRPLTVFVGPSNTGKSYLAVLIYALHRVFRAGFSPSWALRQGPRSNPYAKFFSTTYSKSLQAAIDKYLRDLSLSESVSLDEAQIEIPLTKGSGDEVRRILERPGIERRLVREICRCFGIRRIGGLVRRESDNPDTGDISLTIPASRNMNELSYVLGIEKDRTTFSSELPHLEKISFGADAIQDIRFREALTGRDMDDMLLPYVLHSTFASIMKPLRCNAFYLPSDRTGIIHSHQVVVTNLIRNATVAGIRSSHSTSILSGVLADFIENLISMNNPSRSHSSTKLDQPFEHTILQGTVELRSNSFNYPILTYKPAGWKNSLPIMRTSSMVAEIAPIVLYLRYLVNPGHLLIIEEPESHLHPAMQTLLARELVGLMRAGIRVILTTHSDWFLEQLGNLLRLGMLTEAEQKKLGGTDYVIHSNDEIGVWLFEHNQEMKGTCVREISFDSETGLYPTDYHAVRDSLYNESAKIFNQNPDLFSPLDEEIDEWQE